MNKDDSCYTMMLPCWRFIDLYQNLSDSETDNAVIDDVICFPDGWIIFVEAV